ncbi:nucleotidyltransferase family protein [Photobacterium indicum]|uniref:nucleotidyltransferase family protein n=1 Tax=Photobacterium indicum TaxID=81447 RepID=UPI003D151CB0
MNAVWLFKVKMSNSEQEYQNKTQQLLLSDTLRMECLRAVRCLNLPDCFLGAGFLRNAIWDSLHNKAEMTPLNDIDVVYFDTEDISCKTEQELTAKLKVLVPSMNWEVRNQARMHVKHNDQPYRNTTDAISRWVEIPTCVGVKLDEGEQLVFTAPFGLTHNWVLNVEINPKRPIPDIFYRRIEEKSWLRIWPLLNIIPTDKECNIHNC